MATKMLRKLASFNNQLARLPTMIASGTRALSSTPQLLANASGETKKRIESLVKKDDVVLFMKGTPDEPLCGFSSKAKTVLQYHGVKFASYDVLGDEELRNGVKEYSDWPTIPQVYVKGEFIGGSDILMQLHNEGTFHEEFEKHGIKSKFSDGSD